MERTEAPKVVHVEEADREAYDNIKDVRGLFKEREWSDVFLLAVALGYTEGARVPLQKQTYLARTESFRDDQAWLLKSIAVRETGDLFVLGDERKVWKIAEEYANGGINQLREEVLGKTKKNFLRDLENKALRQLQEQEIAGHR